MYTPPTPHLKQVTHFSLTKQADRHKAEIMLRVPKKEKPFDLIKRLSSFPDVELESLE